MFHQSAKKCFRRCKVVKLQTIRYSLTDSNTINFNNDRGIGAVLHLQTGLVKISYTIIFHHAVTFGRKR